MMRAALALASVLVAAPAPARAADRTAALAAHLDDHAAVAARIDLEHWERAVEAYKVSGMPDAGRNVFLASLAANALLGFDPLVRAGWFNAGIDADQPIFVSGARLGNGWRVRAVLAVDDPGKADRTLDTVGRALPGALAVNAKNAAAIARGLGARDARAAMAALHKGGVRFAGALAGAGVAVALARRGDVIVIDVVHRADLVVAVSSAPRGLAMAGGAARRLRDPGQVVWLHGTRAYDEAARLLEVHGIAKPTPACAGYRDIVSGGPFVDVAVSTEVRDLGPKSNYKTRVKLATTWGLRGPFKLAAAFLLADDLLADPRTLIAEGAVMAGATYLRSLEPLRSLPRPVPMRTTRRDLGWSLVSCTPLAPVTTWLMGWPQVIGLVVDQVAAINGDAARIVGGVRNARFAVVVPSLERDRVAGFAEASVESKLAPQIEGYFDSLFGARAAHKTGRSWTEWGRGRLRPYRWDTAAGAPVLGGALPAKSTRWRMRRTLPRSPRGRLIAEIVAYPPKLVLPLAAELPWLDPLRAVATRMGILSLQMQLDRDTLESFAVVDLR